MTVEKLIDAIAEALFQEFGSDYEIYTEKVEQGLKEPCFMIRCVSPTKNIDLGTRYKRTNKFVIQYIPSTSEAYHECFSVLERLFECLQSVTLSGKPVHGTNLNGEVIDEILNFTVNYDGFELLRKQDETSMGGLEVLTEAKG